MRLLCQQWKMQVSQTWNLQVTQLCSCSDISIIVIWKSLQWTFLMCCLIVATVILWVVATSVFSFQYCFHFNILENCFISTFTLYLSAVLIQGVKTRSPTEVLQKVTKTIQTCIKNGYRVTPNSKHNAHQVVSWFITPGLEATLETKTFNTLAKKANSNIISPKIWDTAHHISE